MQNSVKVSLRKLAIALFSACLVIAPLHVQALGFGNIRINSALNEPLDAEIDLLSATKSDLKGLKIQMASPEAFMRAGIERPNHLSQIQFSVRKHSNGRPYLKLTTRQSVREPFLDFLLEMNWKNGRMLREYTVLLDPPGQMRQQPTMVASPQTTAPEQVAKQEEQAAESPFVEAEPVPVEEPVAEAEAEPAPIEEPVAEAEPEPTAEVVEAEPIEIESEPLVEESIAATDQEEAVPDAESVPEEELAVEDAVPEAETAEVDAAEAESTAQADEAVPEPIEEEPVAESASGAEPIEIEDSQVEPEPDSIAAGEEIDPFENETTSRIPADESEPVAEEAQPAEEQLAVAGSEAEPLQTEDSASNEAIELEESAAVDDGPVVDMQEGLTTQKNDRLWNIAETMLPGDKSVSIYQVMLALQQSNPDAFVEGNVHRLKVGQVLRIEDPSMLTAMSKRQAALEYQAQTQSWEDYRHQLAGGGTPTQTEMAGESSESGVDTATEGATAGQTEGELVLAAPEGDSQSAGTATDKEPGVSNEVVILREEIRQALKEAETEGNKNIELNSRLRELEGQLNELQRSLSVKDDELASLQQQLSTVNQKNTEQELADIQAEQALADKQAAEAAAKEAEEKAAKDAELAAAQQQAEQDAAEQQSAVENATEQAGTTTTETGQTETTVADPVVDPQADTATAVADPTAAYTEPDVVQRKGFLDHFLASLPVSPLILAIAGGGIVVLLLALVFMMKRRREASTFQESILSGVPSDDMTLPEEVSLETNLSGESSFLSDFAISGASALSSESSEVDPLTEADVFMAYGRYEAAEERIQEAINNDPQRNELRIKLLELYNTTRNRESFERAAEEFYAAIGHDAGNQQWQKVIAMGSVLAPDSPLFNESTMAAATDDLSFGTDETVVRNKPEDATVIRNQPPAEPVDQTVIRNNQNEEVLDIGLDTGAFDTDDLNLAAEELEAAPLEMDVTEPAQFETDVTEPAPFETADGTPDLNLDLDVDLDMELDKVAAEDIDDLSFDLPAEETADAGLDFDIGSLEETPDALDLDFNLEDVNTASATMEVDKPEEAPVPEVELDEMTMQALDMNEGGGELTMEMSQPPAAATEEALTMDNITATDMSAAELDATDIMELDVPLDVDEVGTKLDLAKAYIDMGDPDGARSILDEVMTEGSPPQQQEAQQLMQQI